VQFSRRTRDNDSGIERNRLENIDETREFPPNLVGGKVFALDFD
jgi:hypothetical protein